MKKKGLLKGIVLSAACLLVFGTLIGATTGLFQNKTYEIAEAATETKATLTKDNIIAASSSEATINGITFDWGDTEFTVSGSTLSVDADHAANILVFSSGLSSNNVTHVSVNISYTAPALNTTLQIIEGFTNKLVNISLTGTSYSSGDVSIDNSKTLMIKIMNNGNDQLNNLTISSFSLDLKGIPAKSAVTIAKGTGVKSVYLSTSNTATSGSASETEYDNGTTVYGFAELAKGYKAKSGWNKVSGTADTEGAKYRVGSVSAGSSNFGTISADLISYSIGYTLNSGSVSGTNPTSYNVTTNNFTLINPTKTGYTFNGWSGTGISGTSTSVTVSKGSIGNRTYTANWSANKYTITYKDGGDKTFSGTHEDGYPTTHTYGTTTTLKSATKTGYTFDGWFTNSGCSTGNKVTSLGATAYTANITLYAKWAANNYTVTFDDNGGSGGPGSASVIFASYNTPLTEQQLPTKEGYTFAGYYDQQNEAGAASPSGYLYYSNTGASVKEWDKPNDATLYAYYTKDMTISAEGYEADYDGNAHTITITVTDPESGYNIIYKENSFSDISNIPKTNVGEYTIEFYVNKDGYTQYHGVETIVINEVDKAALLAKINEANAYYNTIKDDYDDIASTLEAYKQQIKNNYYLEENVTAAQVAAAIEELANYISTAKVDVTMAKINAIGSGDYSDEKAVKITEARNYYNSELTVLEKAAVTNYATLQNAEALYGPVGDIVAEIETLSAITDLQEFKAAVQTARNNYDALTADQKEVFPASTLKVLTDSEAIIPTMNKIDAIGTPEDTDAFREAVVDARNDYAALTADQKALFLDSVLKVLTDDEAIIPVMGKIDIIGTPENTYAFRGKVESARADYNALTADQKAKFPADVLKVLTDDEAVVAVMDLINACAPVEDTAPFREKVETARAAYDLLTSDQKTKFPADVLKVLTDDEAVIDVMDEIIALGDYEYTETFGEKLVAARGSFDALTDDQEGIFPSNVKAILVNYEKAFDAMSKIEAIGKPVVNDEATREKASAARTALDALTTDQLDLVTDEFKADLENAEDVIGFLDALNAIGTPVDTQAFRNAVQGARDLYDALDEANIENLVYAVDLKTLTDDEAIIPVMDEIDAIGVPENTQTFRDKVASARTNYDALTVDQKAKFPADVLKILTDDEAVVAVMDLINACVPVENTDEFRTKVEAARAAYDLLTDDQKEIFPEDVLKVLTDDEAVVDAMDLINACAPVEDTEEFREKVEEARENYDSLTEDQKEIFPADVLKTLTDDEAVIAVMDEIDAIGIPENTDVFRENVESARESYDALTDDQKAKFPADVLKTLTDDEAVIAVMDKVNAIGDVEYSEEFKERLDKARETYDALTDDQKAIFPADALKTLVDAEKAYEAMDKINNIGIPTNVEEFKARVEDADETFENLTNDQKDLVLENFVKILNDAKAVDNFMDKVNAIGDVELTEESKGLIDDARSTYEALTDDQKNLVNPNKLQELIDAEEEYATMKLVDNIGAVEYTDESKALIDTAREYYDGLSDTQKAGVDNYSKLVKAEEDYAAVKAVVEKIEAIDDIKFDEKTKNSIIDARTAYEALTSDQKAFFPGKQLKGLIDMETAYEALERIHAIGEVAYTEENKTKIEAARDGYNSLTEEQKALIHIEDVETLTTSETIYTKLDNSARITYTILLIIVCILLTIALIILVYLLLGIKNRKKEKDPRMLSVAVLPVILSASYYISAPFLALYILSALLVIVSITDIILAVKNPKKMKKLLNIFKKGNNKDDEDVKANENTVEPVVEKQNEVEIFNESSIVSTSEESTIEDASENNDDEETVLVTENGTTFRIQFIKSFTAKLIQSNDDIKRYYHELKNEILSYKKVNSRVSWHYESFNIGRNQVIKMAVRGKTLCIYFALDLQNLKGSKYRVELCESTKYAQVPCMYRIRNDRRCEYAKDLIAMVAEKFGMVKGENPNNEYVFPYENNEALIAKGLIKELKTKISQPIAGDHIILKSVTVSKAEESMTDADAKNYIENDVNGKIHKGKKGIINIDVLSENFNDGDTIDIEALWAKKLIPTSVGQVKLLAKGTLDKKLNVDLQDYSIQAVKMIVLVGGTVHKAK